MSELTKLIPAITNVLTAPNVDLSAISAKSVRKTMLANDPNLDANWLKSNKESVDELITQIFNTVNQATSSSQTSPHLQNGSAPSSSNGRPTPSQAPIVQRKPKVASRSSTPPAKPRKSEQQISDAEMARQLSAQLNGTGGRSTRGGSSTAPRPKKVKAKPTHGSKKVKSPSKIMDSDGEDDEDEYEEEKSSGKRKRSGKGGFGQKEYLLSDPMADVCGARQLSRTQVVSKLWVYIKENQLQNPRNGREILCDEKLREVFRSSKVNMFSMNKSIGSHLYELDHAS